MPKDKGEVHLASLQALPLLSGEPGNETRYQRVLLCVCPGHCMILVVFSCVSVQVTV